MMERLRKVPLPRVSRRQFGIFALIIALIALNGVFFSQYHTAQAERAEIQEDLNHWTTLLLMYQSERDIDYLEGQLESLQDEISGSPTYFPQDINEVEVEDLVVTSAETAAVELTSFLASASATETVGSTEHEAYTYSVSASGGIADLNSFIGLIEEGGDFPSLRVEGITITSTGEVTTATFTIVVLAQAEEEA